VFHYKFKIVVFAGRAAGRRRFLFILVGDMKNQKSKLKKKVCLFKKKSEDSPSYELLPWN